VSNLPAIILVGGQGTRLRSIVNDRPKPLAAVMGRPFLEWIIRSLVYQGVSQFILATGYRGEMVRRHFGDGSRWGATISYSVEPQPLGTGGALRLAAERCSEEDFLVMNGDSLCNFSVERLVTCHREHSADATMWLLPMEDPSRYGGVELNDVGRVISFGEKTTGTRPSYMNAGIYTVSRRFVMRLEADRPISLEREVFGKCSESSINAIVGDGPFIDIGTPASYACAENVLHRLIPVERSSASDSVPLVRFAKSTRESDG
jgi:NDP-sugar pyrophosphorylase family protein